MIRNDIGPDAGIVGGKPALRSVVRQRIAEDEKCPAGRSEATRGSGWATDLLSDIRLDYKPVVQTRYEPMERKY